MPVPFYWKTPNRSDRKAFCLWKFFFFFLIFDETKEACEQTGHSNRAWKFCRTFPVVVKIAEDWSAQTFFVLNLLFWFRIFWIFIHNIGWWCECFTWFASLCNYVCAVISAWIQLNLAICWYWIAVCNSQFEWRLIYNLAN